MDCVFSTYSEKLAFEDKVGKVKQLANVKTNTQLINLLCDRFMSTISPDHADQLNEETVHRPTEASADMDLFVCSKTQILKLVDLMKEYAVVGLEPTSFTKNGHVGQIRLRTMHAPKT